MKKTFSAFTAGRLFLMLVAATLFSTGLSAQKYDTLHLYYNNISIQPHDTTLKKLDKWIKGLNGKHQDIKIIAYFHKLEFKKYSQERVDELFLVINRKARPLFTITEMKPAKGKDFQRTTVDIIYTPTGGSSEPAAKKEEATEKKKESAEKPEKEKEVASKEADKPEKNESKKEKKSDKKEKGDKGAGAVAVGAGAAGAGAATKATKTPEPEEETSPGVSSEAVNKSLGVVLIDNEMAKSKVGKKGDPQAYTEAYNTNIKKAFQREWNAAKLNFVTPADKNGDIILSPARESKGPMMSFIGREGTFEKTFRVSMMGTAPQLADFMVLAHKVKVFYGVKQEFDREKLTKTLEGKTLYVSAEQSDLDQAKFKAAYSFPFSMVSNDELMEQANGRKKNALYLRQDEYEGTSNVLLIDAESGAIIARAPGSLKVKASTLKDLTDQQKQTTGIYPLTIY